MLAHILSLQIFLPLLGALAIIALPKVTDCSARWIALIVSSVVFVVSCVMLAQFETGNAGFQFVEKSEWFPALGLTYHLGVDGISLYFVLLSTFLTPICIISCWHAIEKRVKEFMIAFLVLETFMVGTFCALDAFLFYVFFEGVLIPMFIIIGVWGGARRVYASFKFFLYTLLGSVLMLVALMALYFYTGTTDLTEMANNDLTRDVQIWLWLAFFASFAVKMPMWPVHTWLPDAHVEAPTAGSVILAGVLLKMGGYGFLRFSLPILPEASAYFTDMVFVMSVIAIVYTALVALVQEDMKKLIAYSSVSHMGFVTLGIFTGTQQGVDGAMFQMLSHGIISAALFLCVGVVYDRLHTREIARYGGLVKNMPKYATVFMVLMLGSVGLPGTSGFVGEFLTLMGSFQVNTYVAVFATTGVVFGAAYMLVLYRKVIFGEQKNADAAAMPDLTKTEYGYLVPLVLMVILFGVAPGLVMKNVSPSVAALLEQYQKTKDGTEHFAKATIPAVKAAQDE
ncbi:MAG: NADH-quinone oxidoreductase subunit M [Micavibrio aeruginosavorus]|uniref:NADH-quinone oxidoreductase subunit M n=1 Tax=Micavibrio aeruginosavorus TaxID=349221 RepID=A0A2W5MT03_9BACT|nr:MAG: NADH-quinone oxidoreductase subunit M [Micavibrio aeruginosavorus]